MNKETNKLKVNNLKNEVPTNQETEQVEKVLNKYGLLKTRAKNGGWNITFPSCQSLVNVIGYKEGEEWKKCRECLTKPKTNYLNRNNHLSNQKKRKVIRYSGLLFFKNWWKRRRYTSNF